MAVAEAQTRDITPLTQNIATVNHQTERLDFLNLAHQIEIL
ncbi:hypothetical protein [Coleofasciculus sp. FACHB-129]|nr:hypothetical protein [Coleofasciculus sp. FACHB-129]